MRAVKSVTVDSERRVIITFLDGSTETLYPNLICCDAEALRDIIKELLEEKADAIVQTISNVTVATFEDGADEALIRKLLVSIDPIQEGTGDPSPENVRPISGRTGLTVVRTGKNLIDKSKIVQGGYVSPTSANNVHTDGYLPIKGGETYVWNTNLAVTSRYIRCFDSSFTQIGEYIIIYGSGAKVFTVPINCVYFSAMWYNENGITPEDVTIDQIELGSAATDYEPYKGSTSYAVNWETEAGGVYGGTIDVVSGKLTVDKGIYTITGSERWTAWQGIWYAAVLAKPSISRSDLINCLSDKLVGKTRGAVTSSKSGVATYGVNIYLGDAEHNTLSEYTGTQIVYTLATPTEIQLTPQEITTLLGTNNIWADSGNILELEYVADTKLYIGESQSGTLGSGRQTISNTDLQPVSEKTVEDVSEVVKAETAEKETQEEIDAERGE